MWWLRGGGRGEWSIFRLCDYEGLGVVRKVISDFVVARGWGVVG